MKTSVQLRSEPTEGQLAWAGDISWRVTASLREALFTGLGVAAHTGVRLDVRDVTSIDRSGVALLIGANHRATATGRRLILIDRNGPVTAALAAMHLLRGFLFTEVVAARNQG